MKRFVIVMSMVVVMATALLAGCEPFPEDAPVKPKQSDVPTQSASKPKAESANTPSTTTEVPKPSDVAPEQSTKPSTTVTDESPSTSDAKPQSESAPESKPSGKPEPSVQESTSSDSTDNSNSSYFSEKEKQIEISPNAGKLEIVGTAETSEGTKYYYLKRIEQKDAICFMGTNSVTWDVSVSCISKPVTDVTTGK